MSDPNVLHGQWQLVRAELAGEEAPELVVEHTQLELVSDSYRVRYAGEVVDQGTFEVGGVVTLNTLILHGKSGPNAGRTIPCVYQLRGDRLRVCYGMKGIAPTEFATDEANQHYLATYRRV